MRFEEHLNEGRQLTVDQLMKVPEWYELPDYVRTRKLVDMLNTIKRDCKYTIQVCQKHKSFFYRGMKSSNASHGEKTVRQDRKPKDSGEGLHKIWDEVLEDVFGWKPRSQGLFVTTDMDLAGDFGREYIVFPVGKWNYLWSKEAHDAIDMLSRTKIENRFSDMYKMVIQREIIDKGGLWYLDDRRFSPYGNPDFWKSSIKFNWNQKEMAIDYYTELIMKETNITKKDVARKFVINRMGIYNNNVGTYIQILHPLVKKALKGESEYEWANEGVRNIIEKIILDEMGYTDKDLNGAIRSGNELIIQTPKYYYFKRLMFEDLLRRMLGMDT